MTSWEPAEVQEIPWGLSDDVRADVDRAVKLVVETVEEPRAGVPLPPTE